MVILTSGSTDDIERLIKDLDSLREKTGLDIHVRKTKAPLHRELSPSIPYKLIATSIDRPGIIHQICKALHGRGINIDDISTNVDNNPVTGANVFQMVCYFLPAAGREDSGFEKTTSTASAMNPTSISGLTR